MNFGKLKIEKFRPENMAENPAIVLIAKRGSGKSWVIRDLMYQLNSIPCGAVISPTDRVNSFYKRFFPDIYIHYEIKPEIMEKILVRQKKMTKKQEDKKKKGLKIDRSAILVMDDCLSQKGKWEKDPSIKEILMNGRHYGLTYILTMQTPLGVTPDLRLNFDYVFLLKEDSNINKKKLYENYASMFSNLKVFDSVFTSCTKDFATMVIDNRKPGDKPQDKVYWFKAKKRRFMFGSKEFRDIHNKCYDPDFMLKGINDNYAGSRLFGKTKGNEVEIQIMKVQ